MMMTKVEWAIVAVVVALIVAGAIILNAYRWEAAERLDCIIDQQFTTQPDCT